MTKSWYIEHGYKMSPLIEQAEIDRAERDVVAAYITPIVGTATIDEDVLESTTGQLAYLLFLQRSTFATRAGAKAKTGYNSADVDSWALLQQEAQGCHLALQTLRAQSGVDEKAAVNDICKIYFKTNFLNS